MKRKANDAGLRKHRPRKKVRFEYIKGRYSFDWTAYDSFARWFSELEREEDGYREMRQSLEEYWENRR